MLTITIHCYTPHEFTRFGKGFCLYWRLLQHHLLYVPEQSLPHRVPELVTECPQLARKTKRKRQPPPEKGKKSTGTTFLTTHRIRDARRMHETQVRMTRSSPTRKTILFGTRDTQFGEKLYGFLALTIYLLRSLYPDLQCL